MRKIFLTLLIIGLTMLPPIAKTDDASLVLYLSFDGEAEEEVEDLTQYGNDGTLGGNPEWGEGKFGNALMFDAVDDQVVVPSSESLNIEEEITMMAWANPTGKLTDDWRTVIGKSPTNVLGNATFAYDIRTDKTGIIRFSLNLGGWQSVLGPTLETDVWHHIAGTYDGKDMILYVNGESVGKTQTDGKITLVEDPFCVGNIVNAAGAGQNEYWTGAIDEVRLWNRALSDDEIKNHMGWGKKDMLAVNPQEKLTTTWGKVKERH